MGQDKAIDLERNHLFYGDCLDNLSRLPAESIDLIYLDPPFKEHKQVFRVEQWVCSQ